MIELIKYELYKLFKQKIVFMTAAVLLSISIFGIFQLNKHQGLYDYYKSWEGPVTSEELKKADAEYHALFKSNSEEELFDNPMHWVYRDVAQVGFSKEKNNDILKTINKMQTGHLSAFAERKLALEEKMYEKVHNNSMYYDYPASQMVDFLGTYGMIMLGTLIIVGLSGIFSKEAETGVDQYIYSAEHGRRRIVHAKLLSALIFVVIISLFTTLLDVGIWGIYEGFHGFQAALQSHYQGYFDESPYSMTLLNYFFLKAGIQLAAALGFAVLSLLVSAIFNKTLISFMISGFIIVLPEFMSNYGVSGQLRSLMSFSYERMMMVDGLFVKFQAVNLFGYPVLYPVFAVGLLAVVTIFAVFAIYKVHANKTVA